MVLYIQRCSCPTHWRYPFCTERVCVNVMIVFTALNIFKNAILKKKKRIKLKHNKLKHMDH